MNIPTWQLVILSVLRKKVYYVIGVFLYFWGIAGVLLSLPSMFCVYFFCVSLECMNTWRAGWRACVTGTVENSGRDKLFLSHWSHDLSKCSQWLASLSCLCQSVKGNSVYSTPNVFWICPLSACQLPSAQDQATISCPLVHLSYMVFASCFPSVLCRVQLVLSF